MSDTGLAETRQRIVPNRVKDKLSQGKLAHSFSIKMCANIEIVGYAAATGYDAVLIDLEHSSFGLETCNQLSVAALAQGITPIVRVPANTSDWISRCLDGGAQAVIVPHVNSAAEAQNVVRYAKFAPLGERSATGGMPIFRYASVAAKYANQVSNEGTLIICMIETEKALEDVEMEQLRPDGSSIAAVEGVDVLLIGSADLTQDMGIPGDFDNPRLVDAYARVSAAAEKASVNGRLLSVGIGGIPGRPDLIQKIAKSHANARYVMSGADNSVLIAGMTAGAAKINNLGF